MRTALFLCCILFSLASPLSGQSFPLLQSGDIPQSIPADLPPVATYDGRFLAGIEFEDRGGRNFFILSELWNRKHTQNTLYATQYVSRKEALRQEWQVATAEEGQEVRFIPHSLRSTDLDGDGYQELSFAWEIISGDEPRTEILLATRGELFVYRFGAGPAAGMFHNPNQVITPLIRWTVQQIQADLKDDGKMNTQLTEVAHAPNLHLVRRQTGAFPTFLWFNDAGTEVRPPGEGFTWLRYARAVALFQEKSLLILHRDGIGAINTADQMHEMWMEFEEGTFLLTDWTWTADQGKFAFAVLNKRKWPKQQTAILVVDLKALEFKEYPVRLDYSMGEIVMAPPLRFSDPESLVYRARPIKGVGGGPSVLDLSAE